MCVLTFANWNINACVSHLTSISTSECLFCTSLFWIRLSFFMNMIAGANASRPHLTVPALGVL